MCADFLEYVAAKFNLNLFVKFFFLSSWYQININSKFHVWKHKIYTSVRANTNVPAKKATNL